LLQSPFAPVDSAHHRWQFSIRGLLVFTVSVAIGASFSQVSLANWVAFISLDVYHEYPPPPDIKTGWAGGLIAVVLFWFCLGVFHQIRDLNAWLAEHRDVEREYRWAARIEVAWRVAVLALFSIFALMTILIDKKLLVLPEPGDRFWKVAEMFREAIFTVLLLVVVGSVPAYRPKRYWGAAAYLTQAVLGAAVVAFFLKHVLGEMGIARLVEIAILGISNSFSLHLASNNLVRCVQCTRVFFWWTTASSMLVGFNWYFLNNLARRWWAGAALRGLSRFSRREKPCQAKALDSPRKMGLSPSGGIALGFYSVLAVLGTISTCVFAVWALAIGYPQMNPLMVESRGPITVHCWIALVILFAIVAAASAYRLTADWREGDGTLPDPWRRNADTYYHEWRTLLVLLAVAIVGMNVQLWFYQTTIPGLGISNVSNMMTRPTAGPSPMFFPVWFNGRPINYLWLALALLALHRAICRRNPWTVRPDLPRINSAQFFALWPLAFAILFSGLFTLAWLSFAIWHSPWYISR
jgi:hypothetical protein